MQFALIAAASTALLATSVNAHGYLAFPYSGTMDTTYNAKIDSSTLPAPYAGRKWNDNPEANAKQFAEAFAASGAKSIKEMMDKASPECKGPGATVDVSGKKVLHWQNDQEKMGFVTSHRGPCETHIDGVMVQQDMECVSKYPGYPAEVPVDYSACKKSTCLLTFYWLALHEPAWQVYKQCATITGSGSGGGNGGGNGGGSNGGGSSGNSTSPVPAPSTSPSNPAPAPAPVGPAPAPAPAPAPSKKPGCKRRVRD